MEKKLKFFFDKKGNFLDIAIVKPKKAISREMGKRFEHKPRSETLPITATFGQTEEYNHKI